MLPAFAPQAFDPHSFYTPYAYGSSLTTYGTPVSSMPPSYYQDTPSYNKSESDSTPEEKKKDPMYLAKRHKNNLAAQKSRKIRRQREESITKTAEMLRAENDSLKSEIVPITRGRMITDLRKQLSSTCQAPAPTEPMRDTANITRPDAYMPYHTFQIGFSIKQPIIKPSLSWLSGTGSSPTDASFGFNASTNSRIWSLRPSR
ncbi:basic region leucine zipper [Cooperia oncophora]